LSAGRCQGGGRVAAGEGVHGGVTRGDGVGRGDGLSCGAGGRSNGEELAGIGVVVRAGIMLAECFTTGAGAVDARAGAATTASAAPFGEGDGAGFGEGSTTASDGELGPGPKSPAIGPNPRLKLVTEESLDARATKIANVARVPSPVRVAPALSAMPLT